MEKNPEPGRLKTQSKDTILFSFPGNILLLSDTLFHDKIQRNKLVDDDTFSLHISVNNLHNSAMLLNMYIDKINNWSSYPKSLLPETFLIQSYHKPLFVLGFSSHSKFFYSYGAVTIAGEGLQILIYARHPWPLICKSFFIVPHLL